MLFLSKHQKKQMVIYFEVGYAKALGKKIIIIHQEGTEANFLESCADKIIIYKNFEDFREKLKKIKY